MRPREPITPTRYTLPELWLHYVSKDRHEDFPAWPSSEKGKTAEERAKWDRLTRFHEQLRKDQRTYDMWKLDIKREIAYMEKQTGRYHQDWIH